MEELKQLYHIVSQFDEYVHHERPNQNLRHSYTLQGGMTQAVPSKQGSVPIDGEGTAVKYTMDPKTGRPC